MEIVIDIPDDMIKSLEQGNFGAKYNIYDLVGCLMHGTPLPKGHGRLIDISGYEKYFNTAITYDDGNHNHAVYTNMIPTIIEADRGENEE